MHPLQVLLACEPFLVTKLTTHSLSLYVSLSSSSSFSLSLYRRSPPPPSSARISSLCIYSKYLNQCLCTLSSHTRPSISPKDLAQAVLSVSLYYARHISCFLHSHAHPHPSLLHNNTEQIFDPVNDLHRSLKELKHFRKSTFQLQMSNIQTWVSAAITHDDTLNSLGLLHDPVVGKIKCKINRVAWVTNNALYMISRLCHSRRIHNSDPTD